MAAFLPAEGMAEIWADGPDAVVVGSLTPSGKAEPVEGGSRLSGQWPYISAVDFSDWALVSGTTPTEDGPVAKVFAVPRSGYEVLDTWFNVGMRATGSNTLVVDDEFVPAARTFDREDLFAGRALASTAPCHTVPLLAANGLSFTTPMLGASRGRSRVMVRLHRGQDPHTVAGTGSAGNEPHLLRHGAGPVCGRIDAVQLLLERASVTADSGAGVTETDTVQNLRDCALAVELLVGAVDRLFRTAGTTGQSAANPMQRFWRDVNAIATHVALQFEPAARAYSSQLFGD